MKAHFNKEFAKRVTDSLYNLLDENMEIKDLRLMGDGYETVTTDEDDLTILLTIKIKPEIERK